MSHKVWKDYKVDDVVGSKRKSVEGVEDPMQAMDAGYMDEGKVTPPNSELYKKNYKRG